MDGVLYHGERREEFYPQLRIDKRDVEGYQNDEQDDNGDDGDDDSENHG